MSTKTPLLDVFVGQWTAYYGYTFAVSANINPGAMNSKIVDNMQTLIGQNTIATASIEATPTEGSFRPLLIDGRLPFAGGEFCLNFMSLI